MTTTLPLNDLPEDQQPVPVEKTAESDAKPKRKRATSVKTTADVSPGPFFITQHLSRTMTIYPLLEEEMEALALLNTAATTLFSIGSGLLMFCVGLFFDMEIQSTVTATVAKEVHVIQWICIPAGIGCLIAGCVQASKRKTKLEKLKTEAAKQQFQSS